MAGTAASIKRLQENAVKTDPTQAAIRLNPRSAEVQNANQAATRAAALQNNGVMTTKGNEAALQQNLNNIQAGGVNQVGEMSLQDQERNTEIKKNLLTQNAGAMGQEGALGYNPAGQFQSDPNAPGNYSVQSQLQQRMSAIDQEEQAKGDQGFASTEERVNYYNNKRQQARENVMAEDDAMQRDQANYAKTATTGAKSDAATAKTAGTSGGTTDKTGKAGEKAPPTQTADEVINGSALASAIGSALEGLPEAGPMQQAILQALALNKADKADAASILNSQLDTAKQADSDTQAFIEKWAEKHKESKDDFIALASDLRDDMDKRLADQESRAQSQLAWQEGQLVREQEKLKTAEIEKMSIALALGGGFGSRAGLDQIAESEAEWNRSISDLKTEYGFKRADLSALYTEKYVDLQNNYRTDLFNATKEYDQHIEGLAQQGFASSQARKQAESTALQGYVANTGAIRKEHATNLQNLTKEANDILAEKRKTESESKKDTSMSTKDKLGFVQSLRSGINQNKTITQANDADGFYGALEAAYNYYQEQLTDPTLSEESRNAAQTAVIGSFARILDPNSVVRNEEYERQVYGQSWVNAATGLFERAKQGGSGMTAEDIRSMKKVADEIHESWETRLQQNMQPFILDIQDWNSNYPDSQIDFAQVIPINRIHLPEEVINTWGDQSGWQSGGSQTSTGVSTDGFATTGAPAQGWRTDRHNNPIAFAVKTGGTNEFTKALEGAGIGWSYGDAFPNNPGMVTVRVEGDPIEGARAVLANSNALQNWYLSPGRPYHNALNQFGISNNKDFKNLPIDKQNAVIAAIYKGEVGDGSLLASIMNPVQPTNMTSNQNMTPAKPKTISYTSTRT